MCFLCFRQTYYLTWEVDIKYTVLFDGYVKRVLSGVPASQVAREIGVNVNSLYTWKARYLKHPEQPFVGSGKLRDDDDELRKLRQQVKDLQQENDFLKKASAFFAKNLK